MALSRTLSVVGVELIPTATLPEDDAAVAPAVVAGGCLIELLRTVTASSVVTEEYQDSAELEATEWASSGPAGSQGRPGGEAEGSDCSMGPPLREPTNPLDPVPPWPSPPALDSSQDESPAPDKPPPPDGWTLPRFLKQEIQH